MDENLRAKIERVRQTRDGFDPENPTSITLLGAALEALGEVVAGQTPRIDTLFERCLGTLIRIFERGVDNVNLFGVQLSGELDELLAEVGGEPAPSTSGDGVSRAEAPVASTAASVSPYSVEALSPLTIDRLAARLLAVEPVDRSDWDATRGCFEQLARAPGLHAGVSSLMAECANLIRTTADLPSPDLLTGILARLEEAVELESALPPVACRGANGPTGSKPASA